MVTRDDLIGYLLHRLPEEARAALAEQWLADPELHEQLRMAEAELLDAYARDQAPPDDRRAIEIYLLASDSQREKLAFAEALRAALPGPRTAGGTASAAAATSRTPGAGASSAGRERGWMTWAGLATAA